MSSSPSAPPPAPAASPAGRPRYLLVALVAALVFGAGCWTEGCDRLSFYRGERDHRTVLNEQIKDDASRARIEALYLRFTEVADAARGRALPFAAATFVLGAALLVLAGRGLGGRRGTRKALVQVVTAQAIVVAGGFYATRDVRAAELDWEVERTLVQQREAMPDAEGYEQAAPMVRAMARFGPGTWLAFRSLASALIVVALTRQRSRAFFEAAADAVSER